MYVSSLAMNTSAFKQLPAESVQWPISDTLQLLAILSTFIIMAKIHSAVTTDCDSQIDPLSMSAWFPLVSDKLKENASGIGIV